MIFFLRLEHVTELLLYDNMLECLPPSIFHMKSLEMLNVDRNHLAEIPDTVSTRGKWVIAITCATEMCICIHSLLNIQVLEDLHKFISSHLAEEIWTHKNSV